MRMRRSSSRRSATRASAGSVSVVVKIFHELRAGDPGTTVSLGIYLYC